MADNHEIVLFMKELRRLLQDYQKYDNELHKEEISKDILLLSTIIYGSKIGILNKEESLNTGNTKLNRNQSIKVILVCLVYTL
ncbi:hypothetical protein F3K44_00645 [Bacillus megaterium]|nr:hypothetical protein [Priestia megaterium]